MAGRMENRQEECVTYHYGKFPPTTLDYARLVEPLTRAAMAVARYDQMLKNMHNSEILLAPMRSQEAVISSRIEGTITTMDEILEYEADYRDEQDHSSNVREEVIETLLYQHATKSAQRAIEDGSPLTQQLVRAIHQRLLSFGRGAMKEPGRFKREQNYLADKSTKTILFTPISPEKLQDGLDALFEYITTSTHQALLKIAISHVEFEALHPFNDGNGRVGRMLITLMLWTLGAISAPHFYISAYLEDNKDQYIDRMRNVSRYGDWDGWCEFFLEAIERQANKNLAIAESIRSLYEEMKKTFSDVLRSKWSVAALDYIFTYPIFRANKFGKHSGIPPATAARFTRVLVDSGLITPREEASGRRAALYSFEPLLRLIRV